MTESRARKPGFAAPLGDLLEGVPVSGTSGTLAGVTVSSIVFDSRNVRPGALFACLPGSLRDGHDFAADAVAAGAVALLCSRPVQVESPQILVAAADLRASMATLACNLYGRPSARLRIVGVTGTNGKTTVVAMISSILQAAGIGTEVIGTLDGARTTPEAPVLQERLAQAVAEGAGAAVMEVSSHGIAQERVGGITFEVCVFTNLSPEHLDYHGDLESYFAAKAALFKSGHVRLAVVNDDDPWGRRLAASMEGVPVRSFGLAAAEDVTTGIDGTSFTWRGLRITIPMAGEHNVANAMAAAEAALAMGIEERRIAEGLAGMARVPGRWLVQGSGGWVVVDYAHTPAALEASLGAARALFAAKEGRVLCVFGCGGNRDRGKRPLMGEIASRMAEVTVVTSDNPRDEDPGSIIEEIIAGVPGSRVGTAPESRMGTAPGYRTRIVRATHGSRAGEEELVREMAGTARGAGIGGRGAETYGAENVPSERLVVVEPDRRRAIRLAVAAMRAIDVVLVAGKGHETTIEQGGAVSHFDDSEEVAAVLARQPVGTQS